VPGTTVVRDLVHGEVAFDHAALGDIALLNADGTPSPTFAGAVDDAELRIDLVLREDDYLDQTPRQLLILAALGHQPPRYAHVGRIVDAAGITLAGLRGAGYLPEALVEHLALHGWSAADGRESFSLAELVELFDLERLHATPSHFDEQRLRAFNGRALRALPRPLYAELMARTMQRYGLLDEPVPEPARRWIDTFLDAFGHEVHTLREAAAEVAKLREESVIVPALELERLRNRQVLFFLDAVSQYVDDQPELRGLPLANDVPAIADEFGLAHEDAFAALRMALTGSYDGPPLSLLFPLLGHDRIMIRIGAISSHVLHGRGLEPIKFGPGGAPFETIQATRPAEPGS
jgi:glutamyl-tRNA synthetase